MRKHGVFIISGVMLALATVFWAQCSAAANSADVARSKGLHVNAAWFLPISHYGLYVSADWFSAVSHIDPTL